MKTFLQKIWVIVPLLLCAASGWAQTSTAAIEGLCTQGAAQATTSGMKSTNYQLGVIPSCRVEVFLTGTTTHPPAIYQDGNNTPQGNPFTASPTGQWVFFAPVSQGYDITLSGGVAPNVFTVPRTITQQYPAQQVINGSTGNISPGSGLLVGIYSPTSTKQINPSNISTDTTGNNLIVPGLATSANLSVSGLTTTATGNVSTSLIINGSTPLTGVAGNGGLVQGTTSAAKTATHCAQFDGNGNVVDAGAACGLGQIAAGSNFLLGAYPSPTAASQIAPSGLATDSTGTNLLVPGQTTTSTARVGTSLVIGNGTPLTGSAGTGGLAQQTTSGTKSPGHCVQFDANGNTIDAGGACGTGGGVSPGSNNAIAAYPTPTSSTVGPSNITMDSTGNNLVVPGNVTVSSTPGYRHDNYGSRSRDRDGVTRITVTPQDMPGCQASGQGYMDDAPCFNAAIAYLNGQDDAAVKRLVVPYTLRGYYFLSNNFLVTLPYDFGDYHGYAGYVTQAVVAPYFINGALVSCSVSGGSGYVPNGNMQVEFLDPTASMGIGSGSPILGTGATATVQTNASGVPTGCTVTNAGMNYPTKGVTTVIIPQGGDGAAGTCALSGGTFSSPCTVTAGGSGYSSVAPPVGIPGLTCTGASYPSPTATVTNAAITSVTTTAGAGCTYLGSNTGTVPLAFGASCTTTGQSQCTLLPPETPVNMPCAVAVTTGLTIEGVGDPNITTGWGGPVTGNLTPVNNSQPIAFCDPSGQQATDVTFKNFTVDAFIDFYFPWEANHVIWDGITFYGAIPIYAYSFGGAWNSSNGHMNHARSLLSNSFVNTWALGAVCNAAWAGRNPTINSGSSEQVNAMQSSIWPRYYWGYVQASYSNPDYYGFCSGLDVNNISSIASSGASQANTNLLDQWFELNIWKSQNGPTTPYTDATHFLSNGTNTSCILGSPTATATAYFASGGTVTITAPNEFQSGQSVTITAISTDALFPLNGLSFTVLSAGLNPSQYAISTGAVTGGGPTTAKAAGSYVITDRTTDYAFTYFNKFSTNTINLGLYPYYQCYPGIASSSLTFYPRYSGNDTANVFAQSLHPAQTITGVTTTGNNRSILNGRFDSVRITNVAGNYCGAVYTDPYKPPGQTAYAFNFTSQVATKAQISNFIAACPTLAGAPLGANALTYGKPGFGTVVTQNVAGSLDTSNGLAPFYGGLIEMAMPSGATGQMSPGMLTLCAGAVGAIQSANVSPMFQQYTSVGAGACAGVANQTAPATPIANYRTNAQPHLQFSWGLASTLDYTSNARIQLGLVASTCPQTTLIASATPACSYAYIRYDTTVPDTVYQLCTDNGSGVPNCVPIGTVAPTLSYVYGDINFISNSSVIACINTTTPAVGGSCAVSATKVANTNYYDNWTNTALTTATKTLRLGPVYGVVQAAAFLSGSEQ